MKIEDLVIGNIYFFTYNDPNCSRFNYIGKYEGTYVFRPFLQPTMKFWEKSWKEMLGLVMGGAYRNPTPEEIEHLEQCEAAGKYVEYKKKTIINKHEEKNTMNKIPKVLEEIWLDKELRKTCIPLFLGNAGLGKTKLIEQFAKEKGAQLIEVIASQLMPHEVSGIAINFK